eukprot:TCONS_00068586-protein
MTKDELCNKIVEYWQDNKAQFSPFIPDSDFDEQLQLFKTACHTSKLSCSLPIVLSSLVKTPIVIITDMQNAAMIPVVPNGTDVFDQDRIWISFQSNQYRFLYRVSKTTPSDEERKIPNSKIQTSNKNVGCRCGQGAKRKQKQVVSCKEFRSRCPCYQKVRPCTDECSCIGCENPHGVKSNVQIPVKSATRVRRQHNSTKNISGKSFLQMNHCEAPEIFNRLEEFVLHEITNLILHKEDLDPMFLHNFYNGIAKSPEGVLLGLREKSEKCLKKKLEIMKNNGLLCRKLILEQGKIIIKAM